MDFAEVLASRVRPWIDKADRLIGARVADARSHAWHALTDRVVRATDGRGTLSAVKRTRSLPAAENRMVELLDALVGPAGNSLSGLIRDARAEFYRSSFDLWGPNIPAAIRDTRAAPTKQGERAARGILVHERELRSDLEGTIEAARRGLMAAVTLAGVRTATDKQSREALDSWAERAAQAIRSRTRTLISDSDVAIFWGVGRSMIREEFRGEE